jgi:hypothetical protein
MMTMMMMMMMMMMPVQGFMYYRRQVTDALSNGHNDATSRCCEICLKLTVM